MAKLVTARLAYPDAKVWHEPKDPRQRGDGSVFHVTETRCGRTGRWVRDESAPRADHLCKRCEKKGVEDAEG